MSWMRAVPWFFALSAVACDAAEPPPSSGGVGALAPTACGRGLVVVASDYASTNVALADLGGRTLSPSFVSSGAAAPGVSAALSGDVVLPLESPRSGEVVLLDRFPNSVLTWMDPVTGHVRAQLSVRTGFPANPHDYVELSPEKAYVSRYESNPAPGRQPFDEGGDLVVVDPRAPRIVSRIALAQPDDGDLLPRADRMLAIGDRVLVSLQRFDRSFKRAGDARLLGVDPARDAVDFVVDLPGLSSCGGMARVGDRVLVACSGAFGNGDAQLDRSGVVLLDVAARPPRELRRFPVARSLGGPVGPSVAYASPDVALGVVFGDKDRGGGDQVFSLDLATGEARSLLRTSTAFSLGDVRCASSCGGACVVADAEAGALRVFSVERGAVTERAAARIGDRSGLPPRYVGAF